MTLKAVNDKTLIKVNAKSQFFTFCLILLFMQSVCVKIKDSNQDKKSTHK